MAALTLFCALLLAGLAVHKAFERDRLVNATSRLAGVGPVSGLLLLILAGTVEIVAAACLLIAPLHFAGALMAASLWAAYALALGRHHGETLDCGCDLATRAKPVTLPLILRPAALAAVAVAVGFQPFVSMTIDAPFAAAGLLALYLGASEILAIPRPAWRTA